MTAVLPLFLGVPILAAALAIVIPWRPARRVLVYSTPLAALATGVALLRYHRIAESTIAVNVGSYIPGVAIPFVSDFFSALMIVVCALVALLALWFADLSRDIAANRFYSALCLLLLGGVFGALLTADLFNLFVMVEVMLMPSYALIALAGGLRRIATGRLFVVINLLTSTLLVAGVGMVYGVTGTVNLAALAGVARTDGRAAFALGIVVLALCIKAGVVPSHGWLPQTYPATSPAIMALFSGLHTKVALYAIIRIWSVAFDLDPTWGWLLLTAALITTLFGAIASTAGRTMRGVLAWQMISGVGVILASVAVGTTFLPGQTGPQLSTSVAGAALTAAIVYMIHHMLTMGGLITGFGALELRYGSGALTGRTSPSGLWWSERPTAIMLLVLLASLIGLPLTSGIVGKFEVARAAVSTGGWTGYLTVAVVLIASLIGLVAVVRLWSHVMWDGSDSCRPPRRYSRLLTAPAFIFAACSIAVFLGYQVVAKTVDSAVIGLVDTRGYISAVLGPEAIDGRYVLPPLGNGTEFRPLAGDDAKAVLNWGGL